MSIKLLSTSNTKTRKGEKYGWLTGILHLAPAMESGVANLCPHASAGCRAACLFTAGRGIMAPVREARIRKTKWFVSDRAGFMAQLEADIVALERKAAREGKRLCVRLNGTSDIPWENLGIMQAHPEVQFYDYTKNVARVMPSSKARALPNYSLTFSRSESNEAKVDMALAAGANVAVVFAGRLPRRWKGRRVVSGDDSDLRFLDERGVVIGLTAKGKAKKDSSGFAV